MNKMDNNMQQIKDTAFNILADFDKICQDNNLTYYLYYGTLLGALRHGGYIPWDDDIDVAMPREDYEKLLNFHKGLLPEHLALQYYKNTEGYRLNFAKITNLNTTVIEKAGQFNFRIGGVYIDIFPIDGAGNSYSQAVRRIKKSIPYKNFIFLTEQKLDEKYRPLYKRIIIRVAKFFDRIKLQNKYTEYLRQKPYVDNKYVAVYGDYGVKEIMEKDFFSKGKKIEFCGHHFNAPEKAEECLDKIYGNYMQLPPKEKRISHHNFIYVNMNLPFKHLDKTMINEIKKNIQ